MAALKGISVDQAADFLRMVAPKPRTQKVKLENAGGRVLAEDVLPTRDQPPFNASAMDGYAVVDLISDEALQNEPLTVVGESLAGRRFKGDLIVGEAVRIFTGAPVPDAANAVIIQENVDRQLDLIFVQPDGWASKSDNIRPRGGDFKAGDVLLEAGQILDPWALSLIAAAGYDKVIVRKKPVVAILSNGDELVRVGDKPKSDQIFESGSHALIALIEQWGGKARFLGAAGDSLKAIHKALKNVKADLIVTIGGASVGDYDLVKPALEQLGLQVDFASINIRPGKPTWLGNLEDGTRVLGLPGNPASAMVCAQLFLRPYIEAALGRYEPRPMLAAKLSAALPANGPREGWLRAVITHDDKGQLKVTALRDQDSSLVTVFAKSNALLRRPSEASAAKTGDLVQVLALDRLV
ncbi:molybdopterin molybdotransferase MoeA [Asticcacaulis endophyticus]|uniref:Molybdopterin molybdenumtransferase n=1 Tax=Asticcacaulis endophyticus TaxID=1395890 RepID=A0A918PYK2_9CAUL|nr:gephyrin-like molybdotransferase Glp [Asticcacaulis endophyticus]GGZ26613.1 molybdopterin molybdenumtransferase MoeA [Asticcacaulis endophyticus]